MYKILIKRCTSTYNKYSDFFFFIYVLHFSLQNSLFHINLSLFFVQEIVGEWWTRFEHCSFVLGRIWKSSQLEHEQPTSSKKRPETSYKNYSISQIYPLFFE